MIFSWLRNRRRRKLLAQPFPDAWLGVLRSNVWQYAILPPDDQERLRTLVRLLVAEKNWEGCGGMELTDEVRVTIAAYAALPILKLDTDSYDHVLSILVYASDFMVTDRQMTHGGFVREERNALSGPAWGGGTVALSWGDVTLNLQRRRDSRNVIIHEFAHELDMLNHDVDGTPPLREASQLPRWRQLMTAEHERLVGQVESGRRSFFDPYGATDIGEFFAVATSHFFERPDAFRRHEPDLYALFGEYYGQDLAALVADSDRRRS